MARPILDPSLDAETFDSYYWYRSELQIFAKLLGLSRAGGKFEIHDRISHYLRTGEKLEPVKQKPTSKFDWAKERLTHDTVITDSYKNSQNVRGFFESEVGSSFSFSIDLMNFMKDNQGAKLADAVDYYKEREKAIQNGYQQKIEEHNQFNLYTREFLADNPTLGREEANKCWAVIIDTPRPGSKGRDIRYSRDDLKFLDAYTKE